MKKIIQGLAVAVFTFVVVAGVATVISPKASAYTGGGCGSWSYGPLLDPINLRVCEGVTNGFINVPYDSYWSVDAGLVQYYGHLKVVDDYNGQSVTNTAGLTGGGYAIWNSNMRLIPYHRYHTEISAYVCSTLEGLFTCYTGTAYSNELYN